MATNMAIMRFPRWCVLFVDLDGTIRFSQAGTPWCNFPEDVRIYPEASERLLWFREAGWRIIGVSNQAGPVMGQCEYEGVQQAITKTVYEVGAFGDPQKRIMLDVLACFHHPDDGCTCRKPRPGMIHMGIQNLMRTEAKGKGIVRPEDCLVVGDREEDKGLAAAVGMVFMEASDWRSLTKEQLAPWLEYPDKVNRREDYVAAGLVKA